MRIGIVHGYGLWGSGSNLYVSRLSDHLARKGAEVHVICQERAEKMPPYIKQRTFYDAHGQACEHQDNPCAEAGATTHLHVPHLGPVLPVYNWDRYPGFDHVEEMPNLDDTAMERYISFSAAALETIVRTHKLDVLHANHVVAMPEVTRRASARTRCPFLITPHGSAIEYAVRRDPRLHTMALRGLDACAGLILGGDEMRDRLTSVFGPDVLRNHDPVTVPMGVDLQVFTPRETPRGRMPRLDTQPLGGATASLMTKLFDRTRRDLYDGSPEGLLTIVDEVRREYLHVTADADAQARLQRVPWGREATAVFTGKLVAGKGVHNLIAAVAAAKTPVNLLVVGEGPFREPLEILVRCLERGAYPLFCEIVKTGWALDGKAARPLEGLVPYLDEARFSELSARASDKELSRRVTFLGYLPHAQLARVNRECDVAVLPSVIPEAYPLALVEAAASGLRPIATDSGGSGSLLAEIRAEMVAEMKEHSAPDTLGDPQPPRSPYMVPPAPEGLVQALADALDACIPATIAAPAATQHSVRSRGWPQTADRVLDLYSRTVGRNSVAS